MIPIEADIEFMHIRMRILQKKAMMHIIIKDLRWKDRAMRWTIMCIAVLASILSLVSQTNTGSDTFRQIITISNVAVVILLKVSEYIRVHRIRDAAKLQYVKYDLLAQKIQDEITKGENIRQEYTQFLSEVGNEFRAMVLSDPILSTKQNILYKRECEALGVIHLEDSAELVEAQKKLTERSRMINL